MMLDEVVLATDDSSRNGNDRIHQSRRPDRELNFSPCLLKSNLPRQAFDDDALAVPYRSPAWPRRRSRP
jgi:hypothetical protein